MPTVNDVFGTRGRGNPLAYVVRDVERQFKEALTNPVYEAVVLYGTSKQGKSSLRRSVLPNESCTFVTATNRMTREGLYREILNSAGARGKQTRETQKKTEAAGKLAFNPFKWLFGIKTPIDASVEYKRESRDGTTAEDIEVDYAIASAVARKYQEVADSKPIVIDNFHHIERDLQRDLATDIRAFGEIGVKIVILGTWAAQVYLQRLNSDLVGRMAAISTEPWEDGDLMRILDTGETLLNVRFSAKVKEALVERCAGSVSLVQNAAQRYLTSLQIVETLPSRRFVDDSRRLTEIIRAMAQELIDTTTERFKMMSSIGEPWIGNHTRMRWLIRSYLSQKQAEFVEGVPFDRIVSGANTLLAREGHQETLTRPVAAPLIKSRMLEEQQKKYQTPIIAYDEFQDRVITVDSWTLFTLRRHRMEICDAL